MPENDRIEQALARLTATLQHEVAERSRVLAAEFASVVEEERMAAEAQAMSSVAVQLAAARTEADARIEEEAARVRADVEQALIPDLERSREENAGLRQQVEMLTQELVEMRARGEAHQSLALELQRSREENLGLRQQVEALTEERSQVRARAESAEQALVAEAERSREDTATLRQQFDTWKQELSEMRERSERAEQALAEAAAARQEAARLAAELDVARQRLVESERVLQTGSGAPQQAAGVETALAAQAAERQSLLATLDRLAAAVRQMDGATTLTDVLGALADGLANQAPRTALFVLAGEGYQLYRSSGFAEAPRQPLSRREAGDLSRGLPSEPLPADHVGYTSTLSVGGQAIAVIYADDCSGSAEAVPSPWPEAVDLLTRHATQRLESLTAIRAVQALGIAGSTRSGGRPVATHGGVPTGEEDQRARRYARLLVSEIKLYNEGAVREGRENRDLLDRLRPEIARARHLYEQRVPPGVPSRAAYFEEELVQTLADGDAALLGG